MLTKKSLLIAGAVTTMGLATAVGANAAFATQDPNTNESLVSKIALQFNLNEADVQAVFDDYKSDKIEAKVAEYLQNLVDKGKITAEQKILIGDKLKEVRATKEQERKDLKAWADQQGVDVKYVLMNAKYQDKNYLKKLVDKGIITNEQKKAIEDKRAELKTMHSEALKELKQWAKDNGINVKYLMIDRGYYNDHDHHGHGHWYRNDKENSGKKS